MAPNSALRRVLIVDDDPVVAESLGLILSGNRYEVRVAHSAESATNLIARWTPELAIVDVLLPGMNGGEFAAFLYKACPGCPVVFFTALPGGIAIQELAKSGGVDFDVLEKPVPPTEMLDKVAALLAEPLQKGNRPLIAP